MCWICYLRCIGGNLLCECYYCDIILIGKITGLNVENFKALCDAEGESSTYKELTYNLTCADEELSQCNIASNSSEVLIMDDGEISNSTFRKKYLTCLPKKTPAETPKITPIRTLIFTPIETPSLVLIESKIIYQEPNNPYLYFIIPLVILLLIFGFLHPFS